MGGSDGATAQNEQDQGDDGEDDEDCPKHEPSVPTALRSQTGSPKGAFEPTIPVVRAGHPCKVTAHMTANSESVAGDGSPEVVELDLPLQHRHASTVRVVAASLGADAGLTVDEIEDLRLGVNEAVSVLADVDAVDGARLRVRFEIRGQAMTVTASRRGVDQPLSMDDIDELAVRILRAVVDEFRVDDNGSFVVVKNALARDGD